MERRMKLCGFDVGIDKPFFLISGPCVVESEQLQMDVAGQLKEITSALGIPFIFKSSYDKANRSSGTSFRGPGMEKGLEILAKVKRTLGVPVLTDVHSEAEIAQVAATVDVLQTPAFLCRQTDFIRAVAQSGKPVNIKKGQFLAPHDMKNVIDKARSAASSRRSRCSRTTSPADADRAPMSSAYIIANVRVTDAAQYEQYKKLSSLAMQAHGAEVCVRGGAAEVLEGDWQPERIVVLK